MKNSFQAVVFVAFLGGCASAGVQVSKADATQFTEGVSTETEIVKKLGQPSAVTTSAKGKTLTYTGAYCATRASTFIPLVGLFTGGMDCQSSSVVYELDSSGVLRQVTHSQGVTSTGMGTSSNTRPPPAN